MEVRAAAEGGCKRVICRVGSLRRPAIWSSQIMSEHQLVMGARGSGPGAGLGTRRPPRIRTLNTSAGHLRPTPRPLSYNLHLHVSHLIHQVSHRRLEVVAPARALPCARMHIGLSDTRAYDASLVVTPREGSHARFEPLEHRTHVRALRCALHAAPNTHCPPRSCTLSLSFSRMLCTSTRARDGVSLGLGAQFRTHRPGRRLGVGMLAVCGYVT